MAEGRPILGELGVPSKQGQLKFDEIFEETIDTETIERQEKDKHQAVCDQCFIDRLLNVIALYMCVVCEKYFCKKCFKRHRWQTVFHKFICIENGKNDGLGDFVSYMMNESEKERNESLRKTNVCVCDYVNTKHELDEVRSYHISGLNGFKNKWLVVCDYSNSCIKVFSLYSNVLQRYIRLGSKPHDVTEIIVENKTTEQDSASCSKAAISETDNKPDRKHLLAVTLSWKRLILILDLGKNPAVIHSKIKTKKYCYRIEFYEGNIYIACRGVSRYSPFSVCIMNLEGVALKTFRTDVLSSCSPWLPYLTILNGNIYVTDFNNDRVVCYNDEGRFLNEIKIDESGPIGICVDRSEDKVYICSWEHNKVYELESDLSLYKSVLDQTTRYMKDPYAMCFCSDKLYVGHSYLSKSRSHVTVVRLL